MFGIGGVVEGLAVVLILAGLGVVLLISLVLTAVLKLCGVQFHKAFLWGFGLPMMWFAGQLTYAALFAPARSSAVEQSVEPKAVLLPPLNNSSEKR